MAMNKRIYSYCYLRAFACAAVVLLHISASESILYKEILNPQQNFLATLLYELMMWAVPCFLMVSGALLLDAERSISIQRLLTRYVRRILLALLIFTFLFRIFDMVMNGEAASWSVLGDVLRNIYQGTGWSHMWYLYLLIGLYLLLPFLRLITAHGSAAELRFLLAVQLAVLSLLPLTKLFGLSAGFYIHVSTIYPFYFLLGHAVHVGLIRLTTGQSVLCLLAGAIGLVISTAFSCFGGQENTANLLNYSSVFVVLMSLGIFSLFRSMPEMRHAEGLFSRLLLSLDGCSFGIYLLHMLLVRYVLRYQAVDLFSCRQPGIAFLGMFAATLTASYGLVWLLRRIPFVRALGVL